MGYCRSPVSSSGGPHPAVILTPDDAAANPDIAKINILIITTVRAGYQPGRYDVVLNGADGLEHLSRARVLPILDVHESFFGRRRGALSATRQKVLARKIREVYRLDWVWGILTELRDLSN